MKWWKIILSCLKQSHSFWNLSLLVQVYKLQWLQMLITRELMKDNIIFFISALAVWALCCPFHKKWPLSIGDSYFLSQIPLYWTSKKIPRPLLILYVLVSRLDFPGVSDSKESACNGGDRGLIPELGRAPRRKWKWKSLSRVWLFENSRTT